MKLSQAFQTIRPHLKCLEISCTKDFKIPRSMIVADQFVFPCYDNNCYLNQLHRATQIADIILLEAGSVPSTAQFILDSSSTIDRKIFYKKTFS